MPPTYTIRPVASPPPSENPTAAMLKADIDSGRTGDKNPVFDPGLSPLGTDDEAAGTPPSAMCVALARRYENLVRWSRETWPIDAPHHEDGFPTVFAGSIVAIGAILACGIWYVRAI
ncbi:hypothetical protein K9B37_14030 [Microvirga sp. WGZ8]|uniref:Uncharacterized protein n=1 Tax=Microvirga puerhi TaxID=2876078 RepID=A0ABS7VQA8_9HYPH|nr:hypothetical protein [Microvirga puerhi]